MVKCTPHDFYTDAQLATGPATIDPSGMRLLVEIYLLQPYAFHALDSLQPAAIMSQPDGRIPAFVQEKIDLP